MRRIYTSLIALLIALPASAVYQRINAPNPSDHMDTHIYRLDNGLTVHLTENHETPRFYAEISVRAGSKYDPAETTGLAHYLEHLLFKGTQSMGTLDYAKEQPLLDQITELYEQHFREEDPETRKQLYAEINRVSQEAAQYAIANEIDKLYKDMGGAAVNAHTWHEETVYKVSLPANRLLHWAAIESERFHNPVFRLFHTELETVYEEKNRSIDNKGRIISEAVNELLYKAHPYGQQTTIGTVEHLKRPSLVNIQNYFDTYYVPNNMAIAISGDIDIQQTIELIDQFFAKWEAKPLPEKTFPTEQPLAGPERVSVNYRAEEYALLAFRTVPRGHPDQEALMLADMILDNAVAGLINLNLTQTQRVRDAGSFPSFMNDYGAQQLYAIPKDDQTLEDVEKLLLEQLDLLKQGQFEPWLLDAIRTDFKKGQKAQLESDFARVSQMTQAFIAHEDWDHTVAQLDRLDKVTKEDVLRVANQYFGPNYVAGYRIDEQHELPQIEKPQIDPVQIDPSRQSQFAKRILALPYKPIEPTFVNPETDYKIEDLAEGVQLYYSRNPLNDLFSFTISVELGSHEDNTLSIATRLLYLSGAGDLTNEDLKKEWYKLGCDYSVSAGDNETFISVSGLDENFAPALALLHNVLTQPTAADETLTQLTQIILQQREDAKKDPGTLSAALTEYNRYGQDSYFLRMLPADAVQQLTVDQLHTTIRNLLDYKHTITYTGSLPIEDVTAAIKQTFPPIATLKDPPPYRFLRSRTPEQNEIYLLHKEMAQAQVRIEFPDGAYTEADTTPIDLYNNYFAGGMSGIVFQELREARALAYSAAARYAQGNRINEENTVLGVIACQADKTPEALQAFLDLFQNLPQSQERFQEATNAITNRYQTSKIGFRQVLGAVRAWQRQGLTPDPREQRYQAIQKATLQDLLTFHKSHIANQPKLISIVGDTKKLNPDQLKDYGEVKTIELDTLFIE